jgi:pyrroloquinoline quinone (PQQ) biosynthesis protein C
MNLRRLVEAGYEKQTEAFCSSQLFQRLEKGEAVSEDYDSFISGVCRSHLKSPHILAFLFALAPPAEADKLKHNMMEELGLDGEGVSHPSLLLELMEAAGFDKDTRARLEQEAAEELRRIIAQPILYGTLRELGLSVLLETVAFEWMLSRTASRIAYFLRDYRRLPQPALRWFHHHSEVDLRHAEEGLDAVAAYAAYYEIDAGDAETILEITFRENVFIKRYFGACKFQSEAAASKGLTQRI